MVGGALGRRQIGSHQIFVDLGKQGLVGVNAVEDATFDRLVPQLAHCFETMRTDDQDVTGILVMIGCSWPRAAIDSAISSTFSGCSWRMRSGGTVMSVSRIILVWCFIAAASWWGWRALRGQPHPSRKGRQRP
jgi:hypothetical protein